MAAVKGPRLSVRLRCSRKNRLAVHVDWSQLDVETYQLSQHLDDLLRTDEVR